MRLARSAAILALLALTQSFAWARTPSTEAGLQLAWLDAQGQMHSAALDAQGRAAPSPALTPSTRVPLGSLWKLVAYAHWVESAAPDRPLQCTGQLREEVYCCSSGERIERATALVRSCGLYFAKNRVPWDQPAGAAMQKLPTAIAQALREGSLGAQTQVPLQDWLQWLAAWPAALQEQAAHDLLGYWLAGSGQAALSQIGGQLRIKTWTLEQANGTRRAGASGWNAQGLPLWFSGSGSSANLVPSRAKHVIDALRETETSAFAQSKMQTHTNGASCVRVNFFARYPIATLTAKSNAQALVPGASSVLRGHYQLRFANGQNLGIQSLGELQLSTSEQGTPKIWAELPLENYVARVIDREASTKPQQAAWALAIAARSHVLAHGQSRQGCAEVDDSSQVQRVSPRPPTAAALEAAQATAGMVLVGGYAIQGQYHQDRARDGVMAWAQASQQAESGARFTDILRSAYPRATLGSASSQGALACETLPLVQAWLDRERVRWRQALQGQPGFADPAQLQVCRQTGARAHARSDTRRIDVNGFHSLEERLSIAHEYLHVAFAAHPRGRDEAFIETRARQLLGVLP